MSSLVADTPSGRFAAFRHQPFVLFWSARFMTTLGINILSVAVLWQIWALTEQTLYLGLVGLVQFVPLLVLVLVTGAAADRFGRQRIMGLSLLLAASCALAMGVLSQTGIITPNLMLVVLTLLGVARAFLAPAASSLVVSVVPKADFANAVTWNSSAWQTASIAGPALGGLLMTLGEPGVNAWMRGLGWTDLARALDGRGAEVAYFSAFVMVMVGALLVFAIPKSEPPPARERPTLSGLLDGIRYIRRQKIVLGAISLDLFAVLTGGVIALLPVFAEEVLQLGPSGLGWLRAAPGIGAVAMAALLALYPIRDRAGHIMFIGVALFGVFTVIFGLSNIAIVSILALICLGAADMVSVVVRETLLQLWTPDEVRGRVNAVNSVFVSASNELGEFRAGGMATVMGGGAAGAVLAATWGGVGAIIVAGAWALMFPQLRQVRRLDQSVEDMPKV